MITNIKVKDDELNKVLLFAEVSEVNSINILFGGNGSGKTTFLNAMRKGELEVCSENEVEFIYLSNSEDNRKINTKKEIDNVRDFVKIVNSNSYSEGQTVIHFLVSFLNDLWKLESAKQTVVLLDEIDSGVSSENINMLMHIIVDLANEKGIQFFIASNNYHFIHITKKAISMYSGELIEIDSYEEYFNILNEGIGIMSKSGKRKFDFLDAY